MLTKLGVIMNKFLAVLVLGGALAVQACERVKSPWDTRNAEKALPEKPTASGEQGKVNNQQCAPITQPKCPIGWMSDTTGVEGGISTNGKCKKWASHASPQQLALPNGAPVGEPPYGFKWDTEIYAWGTLANGGVPYAERFTPPSCL
jgi:hypothetical protein